MTNISQKILRQHYVEIREPARKRTACLYERSFLYATDWFRSREYRHESNKRRRQSLFVLPALAKLLNRLMTKLTCHNQVLLNLTYTRGCPAKNVPSCFWSFSLLYFGPYGTIHLKLISKDFKFMNLFKNTKRPGRSFQTFCCILS